jgi:hypothetical protein
MDYQGEEDEDTGEGTSEAASSQVFINPGLPLEPADQPPPDYESPEDHDYDDEEEDETSATTPRASEFPFARSSGEPPLPSPPIPTYEAATGDLDAGRGRSSTR